MNASRDFTDHAALPAEITGFCLHQRSMHLARKAVTSGFTLIEVLVVVLVMGILCGTGVSIYAGVTRGSQTRARTDELRSFFYACRHRAFLRRTPVRIFLHNKIFSIEQSGALQLRVPELDSALELKAIDVNPDGVFSSEGRKLQQLVLPLRIAGNQIENIIVDL